MCHVPVAVSSHCSLGWLSPLAGWKTAPAACVSTGARVSDKIQKQLAAILVLTFRWLCLHVRTEDTVPWLDADRGQALLARLEHLGPYSDMLPFIIFVFK